MVLELHRVCEFFGCVTCTRNLFTVFDHSFGVCEHTCDSMPELDV